MKRANRDKAGRELAMTVESIAKFADGIAVGDYFLGVPELTVTRLKHDVE